MAESWVDKATIEELKGHDVIIGYMSTGGQEEDPEGEISSKEYVVSLNSSLIVTDYEPWEWELEHQNSPLRMIQVALITKKAIDQLEYVEHHDV